MFACVFGLKSKAGSEACGQEVVVQRDWLRCRLDSASVPYGCTHVFVSVCMYV